MNPNRKLLWGTSTRHTGKVLIAWEFKPDELKVDVYIFESAKVAQSFIDKMFQEWRADKYVEFPNPHDHVIWDLSISQMFPEYIRIDRPDIITSKAKHEYHKHLSARTRDLLKAEIDLLSSSGLRSGSNLWEKIKQLSQRIKGAEEKTRRGDASDLEILLPQHAHELQQLLTKGQDVMATLRKSDEQANFQRLDTRVKTAEASAGSSTNWKSIRDELKQLQADVKSESVLSYEQRGQLSDRIQKAFQTVNTRQDAEREKYKQECDSNYASVSSDVDRARRMVSGSDWREAGKQIRELRERLKGMQLLREQKDELFGKLSDASSELQRQQEKYDSDCESSYQRLLSRAQSVKSSASSSSDFKAVRESIKDLQSAVKDADLKREHREKLRDVLQDAFNAVNANQDKEKERRQKEWEEQKRERERKQQEWRSKMRERADQLERTIREMEIGINRDYTTISDMERKRDNIRSGPKAYDIRQSMNEKISKARERISSKQEKVRNMERQLREIRDKLSR